MPEPTKPRRRFALSLRALMVLVLIIGGVLGWKVRRATFQRKAVAAIEAAGGSVKYDYEWGKSPEGEPIPIKGAKPWAPAWLRRPIGDEYFQEVSTVTLMRVGLANAPAKPDTTIFETVALLDRAESVVSVGYPLTDNDFKRLVAMPRLKQACILDMEMTEAGLDALESSPAIETLQLRFNPAWGIGISRGFEAIGRQPRLKKVELFYVDVPDAASLAQLAKLTGLEYLRLEKSPFDDACLTPLRNLTALKTLGLYHTQLTDAGVEMLAKLDRLDSIYMDGSKLTDAGLTRLAAHPHLTAIFLRPAPLITDAGLASLAKLDSLKYLQLTESKLTDAGLDHLKGMKLENLAISGQGVTDVGLAKLQQMTTLKSLNIVGTNVTSKGRMAFKKAMPGVSVEGGPSEPDPEP